MNNIFRALIAGYGAKKLGGGCFGTVLVFIIIWVVLGECSCTTKSELPATAVTEEIPVCYSESDLQKEKTTVKWPFTLLEVNL